MTILPYEADGKIAVLPEKLQDRKANISQQRNMLEMAVAAEPVVLNKRVGRFSTLYILTKSYILFAHDQWSYSSLSFNVLIYSQNPINKLIDIKFF